MPRFKRRRPYNPLNQQSEKALENAILKFLKYQPGYYHVNNTVGIYDEKIKAHRTNPNIEVGLPDISGFYSDGRAIYIEVKKHKNTDRPKEQIEFIDRANDNHCFAIFADCVDDVVDLFDRIKKGLPFDDLKDNCLKGSTYG